MSASKIVKNPKRLKETEETIVPTTDELAVKEEVPTSNNSKYYIIGAACVILSFVVFIKPTEPVKPIELAQTITEPKPVQSSKLKLRYDFAY